jgi:hypothetical protein
MDDSEYRALQISNPYETGLIFRSSSKSEQACELIKKLGFGLPVLGKILGGEEAEPGEFPHMAGIGYSKENLTDDTFSYDCGGSLISRVSEKYKIFNIQ